MTIPNLLLTVLLAAIFAAMVLSYVKKLRRGENCCGTRNVKVKKKRLRKPAGTFMLEVEGMHFHERAQGNPGRTYGGKRGECLCLRKFLSGTVHLRWRG